MSHINATEARQSFGQVIQRAYSENEHLIVEKNGLPVVVILSFQEYEQLRQEAASRNLEELSRSLSREAKAKGLTPEMIEEQVEETKQDLFNERYA